MTISGKAIKVTVRVEIGEGVIFERTATDDISMSGRVGNPLYLAEQIEEGIRLASEPIVAGVIREWGDIRTRRTA